MPSGVFKITDIPEDKVPIVVADYATPSIRKNRSGRGTVDCCRDLPR